ncbi:MAG: hypothetical protein WD671_00790 [Parvibaculum sp.]
MIRQFLAPAFAIALMALAPVVMTATPVMADVADDIDAVLADTTMTDEEFAEAVAAIVLGAEDPVAAAQLIADKIAALSPPLSDARLAAVGNGLGAAVAALNETNPTAASQIAAIVTTMPEAVELAFAETAGMTASVIAARDNSLFEESTGDKSAN